jgi:tetratricopeptide (TPR) repeat protein
MGCARRRAPHGSNFALLIIAFAASIWAGPGFGTFRKKNLELQTRQPAIVRLANTAVAFKGSVTSQQYRDVEAPLLATLETELISNERTLVKKDNPAEAAWILNLKVTGYALPPPQVRSGMSGKTPVTYNHWNGSLNVAYEVLDHNGRVHDANNVSYRYDKEYEASQTSPNKSKFTIPLPGRKSGVNEVIPHSQEDVKQILVKEVVHQIAEKLGNTTKTVEVQVAGGDEHLNRAAEFMDKRLYSRALEELEKTPEFAKPEEEAYRQYDLGLAYEAMSYEAKTSADQRANIFKATEYYDKALELHPKEKYFVETVARTKDAIARYKALDSMHQEDQKRQKDPVAKTADATPAPSSAARVKTIGVGDVIEMYSAGVTSDQIIDIIRNSRVEFDYRDKDTVVAIAKAKLPIDIQNELRKKVGAPPLAAAGQQRSTSKK